MSLIDRCSCGYAIPPPADNPADEERGEHERYVAGSPASRPQQEGKADHGSAQDEQHCALRRTVERAATDRYTRPVLPFAENLGETRVLAPSHEGLYDGIAADRIGERPAKAVCPSCWQGSPSAHIAEATGKR